MRTLLTGLAALLAVSSAFADDHDDVKAEVMAAAEAFNEAYVTNDHETYFGFYAEDAEAWWFGERVDMDAYHEASASSA